MSLAERLTEVQNSRRIVCTVGVAVQSMTDDDRATLDGFLASDLSASVIARMVNAEYGTDISQGTMQRHRRQDCTCHRECRT